MLFESVIAGILTNFLTPEVIHGIWKRLSERKRRPTIEVSSVRRFWKMCRRSKYELREGMVVTIRGTLSKYAPMIVGDPRSKRDLHKEYRKKLKGENADPMLSLTSGNTVWRIKPLGDLVYLGLYQGIARNSIPIFVKMDYYSSIEGIFFKNENPYCVDVVLTGVLGELPSEAVRLLEKIEGPIYGLFVGGEDTKIEYYDEAGYLDADIWVALRYEGEERMVSRFLDLGDFEDFEIEREKLKEDVKPLLSRSEIILQFDQVRPLFSEKQTIAVENYWKRFLKFR